MLTLGRVETGFTLLSLTRILCRIPVDIGL